MICEDCGETNKPGTEFCLFCGAYLGWQAAQPTAGDTTEPIPVQSPAPSRAASPAQAASAAPAARQSAPPADRAAAPRPVPPPNARPIPTARPTPSRPDEPRPTQVLPATAAPVAVATQPAPPAAPEVAPTPICPTCSRPVDEGRRFCGHCGVQFVGPGDTGLPVTRPTPKRETWWTRFWDTKDRLARREYRRSLPPLYRWRRVIIGVLALVLLGGGLTLIGRSPKSFVLARYDDLRKTVVPVTPVAAATIPADGSAQGTKPESLVDGTAGAWAMAWTSTTQGTGCGVAPATPVIELSFADRRIRAIDLRAGLLANNANRPFQYRPQNIWIAYGDQCTPFTLTDVDRQTVPLDTKVPVSSLRIGVQSAFAPAQPQGAQQILTITEITLLARPATR